MKVGILLLKAIFCFFIFLSASRSIGQPVIKFTPAVFAAKPFVAGQIKSHYFCIYPNDSIPQLVVYNDDLQEISRSSWGSLIPEESFISCQTFAINNKLTILLQQKVIEGLKIRSIDLDENGVRLNDRMLITDRTLAGAFLTEYHTEISKNNKYILLYRGVKINSDSLLFKGYLFDNNWNSLNQFEIPVEKHETEDNWFGAMVDVQGNIQSFVFSAADSWRKGTKLRIHTVSRLSGEMKSEQIEIGRKRLINYAIREDTLLHNIQLQAIVTRQQKEDRLNGLAFISFPFQRNGKIGYTSHEFSRDEKKRIAKGITSGNNLLESSIIESPSPFTQGGLFFTSILAQGDTAGFKRSLYENRVLTKEDEFSNVSRLPVRNTYGNSPYNSPANVDPNRVGGNDRINKYDRPPAENSNKNSYPVRLTILTNASNGTNVFWAEKMLLKVNRQFYDGNFSFVKVNALKMLTYIFDIDKPALYVLTTSDHIEMKKMETPENSLLFLSDARMINENTCLIPYVNNATKQYGIVKFAF